MKNESLWPLVHELVERMEDLILHELKRDAGISGILPDRRSLNSKLEKHRMNIQSDNTEPAITTAKLAILEAAGERLARKLKN